MSGRAIFATVTQKVRDSCVIKSPFLGILRNAVAARLPLQCPSIPAYFRMCLGIVSRKDHAKPPARGIVQTHPLRMESRGFPARCPSIRERLQDEGRCRRLGVETGS
jgi:hypothetical protein